MPQVLFSVLHARNEGLLMETLASIHAQTFRDFAVLVTDGGDSAGLPRRLRELYPEIVYIKRAADRGVASGRNCAMAQYMAMDCEFVFLLDNDISLDVDCLSRLLQAARVNPRDGMLVPAMRQADGGALSGGGFYWRALGQPFLRRRIPARSETVDFATGTIGLCRKAALLAAGRFDERFDPYGFEDVDYGLRLRAQGFAVRLIPDARCRHLGRYSFHQETEFHVYHTARSRFLCAYKHAPRLCFFLLFLPWFLARRVICPAVKFAWRGEAHLAARLFASLRDGWRLARAPDFTGGPP